MLEVLLHPGLCSKQWTQQMDLLPCHLVGWFRTHLIAGMLMGQQRIRPPGP